jgi:hypothetical protein
MTENINDYYTTTEAAATLHMSQGAFSKLPKEDREKIRILKIGRSILWNKEDVERLARERAEKEAGK